MAKLPILSGKDVVKTLERLGFEQIRQRGSHVILPSGDDACVVPLHKEVKAGTLAGIIRQAGLTRDEFLKAVK